MTELDIQKIENKIVTKKMKDYFTGIPKAIRDQLSTICEMVLTEWKIDTIYSPDIQLKIFQTVGNSLITLDEMELAIKLNPNNKISFARYLKRIVRLHKKHKRSEYKLMKKQVNGKVA